MRTLFGGSAASADDAARVATIPAAASKLKSPNFVFIVFLPLKWIRIRLVLDGHPLPAGEFFPVGGAADARAVAGRAGSAEGNARLVGHSPIGGMPTARAQPVTQR